MYSSYVVVMKNSEIDGFCNDVNMLAEFELWIV